MKQNIGLLLLLVVTSLPACSTTQPYGHGDVVVGKKTLFRHNANNMKKLDCTECHDKLYTTVKQHNKCKMEQVIAGESCGTCHNGKRAFSVTGNCNKCHKKQ
jgi:c(7)-type cytochrome triheme protein